MIGVKVTSGEKGPGIEKIKRDMAALLNMEVLIGIPEDKTARKDTDKVNNAQLLYIHTHGSALQHIPARPVIEPAIEADKEKVADQLEIAAKLLLDGKPEEAKKQLQKVGLLGQNIAREWFTDPRNGWAPNAPYTIIEKLRKQAAGSGKNGKIAKAVVDYYDDTGGLDGVTGIDGMTNPLIDTAQMLKSIVWILRDKGAS